jgi:hypothetical protein
MPDKLHPPVAKTLSLARKATPDRNGAISGLGQEAFRIRAHMETLDRIGTFLNSLVYTALARGHRFEAGRDRHGDRQRGDRIRRLPDHPQVTAHRH